MAESPGSGRAPQWQDALAVELRVLSPRLDVPPAAEQAAAVRRRLEAEQRQGTRRRRRARPRPPVRWRARILYPRWRAALIVALTLVALAVAIPQSRAAIAHVLRLDGVEVQQAPGPPPAPHPSLPGEQRITLEQARQRVAFPIFVPATPAPSTTPTSAGVTAPAWLIATIVSAVAAAVAIAGTVLWLRRRSRSGYAGGRLDGRANQPG